MKIYLFLPCLCGCNEEPFETPIRLRYIERNYLKILNFYCHQPESKPWDFLSLGENKYSKETRGGAAALEVAETKYPADAPSPRYSAKEAASRKRRLFKAVASGNPGPRIVHSSQYQRDTGR